MGRYFHARRESRKALTVRCLTHAGKPECQLCPAFAGDQRPIMDRTMVNCRNVPPVVGAYDWESVEGREAFRLLCGVIDKALPFESRSGFYAAGMAERLYFVTHGSIGRLKDFLFNAGSHAINEDAPSIGLEHLRRAYDEQKKPGVAFNAFVDDLADAPDLDGDKESPLRKRTINQLMSKKCGKDD